MSQKSPQINVIQYFCYAWKWCLKQKEIFPLRSVQGLKTWQHVVNETDSPYIAEHVKMCVCVRYCIACLASMPQVSPHAGHSRHSWPSVGLHHGNTNHTLFTPLYEAGKHGNQRENVCVCVGGGETGDRSVWGTQICGCCSVHTHTHTHTRSPTHKHTLLKIQITFSQLSPLEQSSLCGCCSSLSGLFGSLSGGH